HGVPASARDHTGAAPFGIAPTQASLACAAESGARSGGIVVGWLGLHLRGKSHGPHACAIRNRWRTSCDNPNGIESFSPGLSTLRSGFVVNFTVGIAATEDGRGTSYPGFGDGIEFNPIGVAASDGR